MKQILLSLRVRGKKDLVLLRQRTRQVASLLGYGVDDQAVLAAGVFDLACQIYGCRRRSTWNFMVQNRHLHILPDGGLPLQMQIQKSLPENAAMSDADIRWATRELSRLVPLDVFGEMQKLNQELLGALLEARSSQRQGTIRPAA